MDIAAERYKKLVEYAKSHTSKDDEERITETKKRIWTIMDTLKKCKGEPKKETTELRK